MGRDDFEMNGGRWPLMLNGSSTSCVQMAVSRLQELGSDERRIRLGQGFERLVNSDADAIADLSELEDRADADPMNWWMHTGIGRFCLSALLKDQEQFESALRSGDRVTAWRVMESATEIHELMDWLWSQEPFGPESGSSWLELLIAETEGDLIALLEAYLERADSGYIRLARRRLLEAAESIDASEMTRRELQDLCLDLSLSEDPGVLASVQAVGQEAKTTLSSSLAAGRRDGVVASLMVAAAAIELESMLLGEPDDGADEPDWGSSFEF